MSNGPSSSMENAPLLTDARTPNDLDNDEEAPLNNSGGGGARGPRTREAPRDHANFFPLRHGKFSKLEILLAIVCVVFLILMSIFAGLYARGKMDHTPPPQQPPPIIPKPNDTIQNPCLTPDCVVTAAQIINDMDPTANPCEEFFQYTCGGWIQNHVIPEDKGRYGYFDSLYEDNQKLLKEILENDFESTYKFKPDLPPPSEVIDKQNFYKLQSFYQSCMNESLIKELGGAPLLPILNKILDDFPVDPKYSLLYNFGHLSDVEDQRDVSPNPLNLTKVLASLSIFGIRPLFEFYVDADAKDPKNNVLYLSQSGLGLPSKEYYEEEEILSTYKDVMITLLDHALDYDNKITLPLYNAFNSSHDIYDDLLEFGTEILLYKEWEKNAIKIIDFEKKLAKISLSAEEFSDPEATYNNQTIVSLSRLSPSFLWSTYISTLLPSNSDGFPSRVILTSDRYFEELSKLVNETPTSTLQLYFIWQAIYNYADNLSEDFRAPIRKLRAKLRGTDETVRPKRWEECLKSVDNTLGLMAGRYFVLRAFGGQSKEMADQIIFSLKDAFIERLPQLDWLDEETREKAIEKVNRIIQKIGYPVESPDTMSPQSLAEYYEKIDIKEDKYFENLVSAYAWASEKKWKKVGKPVDLGQWYMTPQTVNAYYNPTANEIVFPAGILQSPFFNARAPEYINYGAIGMVVGHELTHAFDNNGRQYDASGKLTQWWSNATIEAFKEKAQCFVYQYGNYTIDGPKGKPVNLNGVLTLGENLADNGGLKESFNAWLARFEENNKNHNNQLLPGLQHLTREQLFYISFGRSWCSRTRPETAVERVRVDPHSPAIWRVNGVLRNSEHFAKTFNCRVGSKMNPVDKCSMW